MNLKIRKQISKKTKSKSQNNLNFKKNGNPQNTPNKLKNQYSNKNVPALQ